MIKWKLCVFFKPNLKLFGNEYIVFDSISGDTFRISLLEGYIIEMLMMSPSSENELFESIQIDDCSWVEVRQAVSLAVSELKAASMVETLQ